MQKGVEKNQVLSPHGIENFIMISGGKAIN